MYSIDRKLYAPPEQTPHPNWSKWKLRRLVELWEATSLSLNLEPTEISAFRHRSGKFDDDSFLLFSPSFMERLLVAYSSIATSFGFSKDHEQKAHCLVELPKFAGWAVEVNLPDLPLELAAMAEPAPTAAPVQKSVSPAPVVTEQTDGGCSMGAVPDWCLITLPNRLPGYRWPLYDFLKKAHVAGKPCPKAKHVLDAWKLDPPQGMKVSQKGRRDLLEYELETGDKKTADLKAIQAAIDALIVSA